jgi:hypothetical protein
MSAATELLRRALDVMSYWSESKATDLMVEIRTYLSNPSDDAEEPVAIIEEADYGCWGQILPDKSVRLGQFLYLHPPKPAEPEAEPVYVNAPSNVALNDVPETDFGMTEPVAWVHCKGDYRVIKSWSITDDYRDRGWTQYPLYLHPPRPEPSRKPMTKEEIWNGCEKTNSGWFPRSFAAGVRWAEKHHGISEEA